MALLKLAPFKDMILELRDAGGGQLQWNHVLEPEYHQDCYAGACASASGKEGAFQLGNPDYLAKSITRGVQPSYADSDEDPDSLEYEGMVRRDGTILGSNGDTANVCALKSIAIRSGYVDFESARCVSREFFDAKKLRAGVRANDVLINSTGDGTIGRVAMYDRAFPALVDGHVTIVRFKNANLAWYAAAYLMSPEGQNQIYRYINGSSGQVEIYPQDIERMWIPKPDDETIKKVADKLRSAVRKHQEFATEMKAAMALID